MPAVKRSEFVGTALVIIALGTAGVAAIARHAAGHRQSFASIGLIDQAGRARSLQDWRGRIVILDFIYTACGDVCPLKTAQLARVQAALPPRLRARTQFVTVSIDPGHDDPPALHAYAARAGADLSNWAFLTGDFDAIAAIAAAFDATTPTASDPPDHITIVRLLDGQDNVVHQYDAEPLDETRLRHDIEALAPTLQAAKG